MAMDKHNTNKKVDGLTALRRRNRAVLFGIIALCIAFYLITVIRIGGAS